MKMTKKNLKKIRVILTDCIRAAEEYFIRSFTRGNECINKTHKVR